MNIDCRTGGVSGVIHQAVKVGMGVAGRGIHAHRNAFRIISFALAAARVRGFLRPRECFAEVREVCAASISLAC